MRAPTITLTIEERSQLECWVKSRTVAVRLAQRAQSVLREAYGIMNKDVARQLLHSTQYRSPLAGSIFPKAVCGN